MPKGPFSGEAIRIWFHASSLGELESMVPLMLRAAAEERRMVITFFSRSAQAHAQKIATEIALAYPGAKLEYVGFGPWEGQWKAWVTKIQPSLFVTAKYESWPELWMALAERGVPLMVLAARPRRNFYVAEKVLRLLGAQLPQMDLVVTDEQDAKPFHELFPKAGVHLLGDPRWERVRARQKASSPRVGLLLEAFHNRPRPWGGLAQVWLKDLEYFGELLKQAAPTLWVVPHDIDEQNILKMTQFLNSLGIRSLRTSKLDVSVQGPLVESGVIFVDERGLLAELYPHLDWAYVGGGFSKGVHSTIEPALQAIPISCAPKNIEKFAEIGQLMKSGQLTVTRSKEGLEKWLRQVAAGPIEADQRRWKGDSESRVGATERIYSLVRQRVAKPELS
ncbi:MAG: 3-deoxy-D-manno-octulosonic acid transferase [Bdellovibrionota bacterium]